MGKGKVALIFILGVVGTLVALGIIGITWGGEDLSDNASSSSSSVVTVTETAPSETSDSPNPTFPEEDATESTGQVAEVQNSDSEGVEEPAGDSNAADGNATREQRNALRSANNYLNLMAFSDPGSVSNSTMKVSRPMPSNTPCRTSRSIGTLRLSKWLSNTTSPA